MQYLTDLSYVSLESFRSFIKKASCDFLPPLLPRIDVDLYYEKLSKLATSVVCMDGDKMVGIVAVYCNNMETKVAYIPLVCVDVESRGQHIATELMNRAISLVKSRGMLKIGIHTNNKFAKSLYVKMGFQLIWARYQTDIKTDRYYLEKNFN